jgi:hypothetical protein
MVVRQRADTAPDNMSLAFQCPECGHEIVMQTNSGETQLVQSLGVRIGSPKVSVPPLAGLRAHLSAVHPDALDEDPAFAPHWTAAAEARLEQHSQFLQPLIRKANIDYARRQGLREITPEVMDACKRAQTAP